MLPNWHQITHIKMNEGTQNNMEGFDKVGGELPSPTSTFLVACHICIFDWFCCTYSLFKINEFGFFFSFPFNVEVLCVRLLMICIE